jgi:hypothetical protein
LQDLAPPEHDEELKGGQEIEVHESMIEPIKENDPFFKPDAFSTHDEKQQDTVHESLVEPLKGNKPMFEGVR